MNTFSFDLKNLGWDSARDGGDLSPDPGDLIPARVLCVERGQIHTLGPAGALRASATGKMIRLAEDPLNRPVVGDWVLLRVAQGGAVYEEILPRSSYFVRMAPGGGGAPQAVAANVDRILIVTAPGADLSPRRIERYLAAIWDGGAEPVLVVNKTDLVTDWAALIREVSGASLGAPVAYVSATEPEGLKELYPFVEPGKTVALVGSSGVGKSTLTNALLGDARQQTQGVREADDKGRHTTTQRHLFVAPSGALVIDTPGMREFGLYNADEGLGVAFADIQALAKACRFRDCTHGGEPGCAVEAALADGSLDPGRLQSFQKLLKEVAFEERRADPTAARNAKARWKAITKSVRQRYKMEKL